MARRAASPLSTSSLQGMGIMLFAAMCGGGVSICYRLAIQDGLPVPMAAFGRGLMTLAFLLPWFIRMGPSALATRRPLLHAARCIAGLGAFMFQLLGIGLLPLADAVALISARPLWVLPLAALLLHERVRRDRVLATAIGFLGVIIVAQPEGHLSFGTVAALAGGLGAGVVLITFKLLSTTEPAPRVIAWYAIVSVLVWGPVSAFVWETPSLFALAMLVGGTLFALASDLAASAAARRCEVGLLAPIEYSQIPFSALAGWLLFSEQPGWSLALGTAVMLGATVYLVRRGG